MVVVLFFCLSCEHDLKLSNLFSQFSEDRSSLIQQAVEEIASAPFLMDLRLVLDWAKFQSVGVLEDFLCLD